MDEKWLVCVWGLCIAGLIGIALAIDWISSAEKELAFKNGCCSQSFIGEPGTYWVKCK